MESIYWIDYLSKYYVYMLIILVDYFIWLWMKVVKLIGPYRCNLTNYINN